MKLILCANPREAATYALHQGWALAEWSTIENMRKTKYDEVHVIPTWAHRADFFPKRTHLRHMAKLGYLPETQIDAEWPIERPEPVVTMSEQDAVIDYATAADERICELEEEVERLEAQVVAANLANRALEELIASLDTAPADDDAPAVDLETLKRSELKKIARSKGIQVTSQTDAKIREQIRAAS